MSDNDELPRAGSEQLLDEAETLIWALLDDHLEDADTARLCQLMEESPAVRSRYIDCVQLHVDLTEHFAAPAAEPSRNVQVLPNLLPGMTPGIESFPRVTD